MKDRVFDGGGSFKSKLSAYYLEDKWQVSDDLVLNIGVRVDKFSDTGTTGKLLTEFNTKPAPRLGFSWDPKGDGESKVYGTFGTYYLPVANNTVYRAASGVSDTTTHYTFGGINPADGTPTNTNPVNGSVGSSQTVGSVSKIPEKAIFQAQEAKPFSKDEFILGYESTLNDQYSIAIKGTYRYVKTALDDYCGAYAWTYCVLVNPGSDMSWYHDGFYYSGNGNLVVKSALFDGKPDPGSLTTYSNATQIQLPKAKNKYYALQSTVKFSGDKLNWTANYT